MTKSIQNTDSLKISKEKKIAKSSIRVLELLKVLTKSPLTTDELLNAIEEKADKVYRKEVVIKYLNTLKLFGIKIAKENGRYCLLENIEKINFDKTDLSLMKFLEKYAQKTGSESLSSNLHEIFKKAEMSFSSQTKELVKQKTIHQYRMQNKLKLRDENITRFEKYCKDEQKLEIKYKTGAESSKTITCKINPLKIMYKKGNAVLIAYDCTENTYREFVLNFISDTKQLPQKTSDSYTNSVTFKLKNRLAKSYVLKENEKILESKKDYIVVSNSKEDRDLLVRRLSRYFDNCEILYPKDFRKKMTDYLDSIEKVYE